MYVGYDTYRRTTATCPPSLGLPPLLYEPSLGLSVVPLGIVLVLYASIMLAIVFELSHPVVTSRGSLLNPECHSDARIWG